MIELLRTARWVFFDLGNTIIDETDAVWDRVQRVSTAARGLGYKAVSPGVLYERLVRAAGEFRERPIAGALDASGVSGEHARQLLGACRYDSSLEKLYPSAIPILQECSKRTRVGYIANQSPGLRERLAKSGVSEYFESGADSGSSPFYKPQPQIFEEALSNAGCGPGDAVMIGDRIDNDIAPARKLGFRTIRVRQGYLSMQAPRNEIETADVTVEGLEQLLGLLG